MKRSIILLSLLFAFVSLYPLTSKAESVNASFERADKLLELKMFNDGYNLIQDIVVADPANPEIHFRAGMLYAKYLEIDSAITSFENVQKTGGSKKLLSQISENLRAFGSIANNNGDHLSAYKFYQKAYEFDASEKTNDLRIFLISGKEYLAIACKDKTQNRAHGFARAFDVFSLASKLDPGLKTQIGKIYVNYFLNSSVSFTDIAENGIRIDPSSRFVYIDILFDVYNRNGSTKSEKAVCKNFIRRHTNKEKYFQLFPYGDYDVVTKKTFVGKGYSGGEFGTGGFKTFEFNVDIQNNDILYIEGKNAQIYSGGMYRTTEKETIHMTKGWVWMRSLDKESFTVTVIRK